MRHQRGDSDMGALIIAIMLMIFLFSGDPDAWDKLHAYVMSLQPITSSQSSTASAGSNKAQAE